MILEYYKDTKYSLSYIRTIAQSETSFDENPCTGINVKETDVALTKFGLGHYTIARGISAAFVRSKVATGPVLVGVWYGRYPNKVGDGRPNQAEYEGRNDYGFLGSHAVLAIGSRYHNSHYDLYMRDPDHASPSRPNRPKYDIIKQTQLQTAMEGFANYTDFGTTYCMYPTKKKVIITPPSGDTLKVKVTCDTIARRDHSISSDKLGSLNSGDILTVTATTEGSHWSGCGKTGTKWRRFTHVNGKSTMSKWGRAYAYCAAGLTTAI